jgi:vitamin K-dependent gamma-carboxylase
MKRTAAPKQSFFQRVRDAAFAPVDIASLVFFRLVFGGLMIWETCEYLRTGWIDYFWIKPHFLFKFYGFSWVQPWPGHGMYVHWVVLAVLAVFITAGFLYRASTTLFCLGLTYSFLLDEAQYLSHFYLLCLFSFLLIFVPAHRTFSIDAWLRPKLRSQVAPAWSLWLLRFQIAVVYFFSGIGKLVPDWLQGELLRSRLAQQTSFPVIGRFFREEWMVYTMSYSALFFDLLIVPLMLWRRTRLPAFCLAVLFNLMNARLFNIYVFPWFTIAATALYFRPDWPRRALALIWRKAGNVASAASHLVRPSLRQQRVTLALFGCYAAIQLLVPIRHYFYDGGIEWTHEEHRFTWRMMLISQRMAAYFYVTDPNSGVTVQVQPYDVLTQRQADRMTFKPDMILQFAHHLARTMPNSGPLPLRVEARVLVSINGRKPQLFVNPNVDLAAEPRTWGRPRWLLEVHDPLPVPRRG